MRILMLTTTALLLSQGMLAQDLEDFPESVFRKLDNHKQDELKIKPNYYKLKGNIDNPEAPAFIEEDPDAEVALENAMELMPYYFEVEHEGKTVSVILLKQHRDGSKTHYSYLLVNPRKNQVRELPTQLKGDLTEHRAQELIEENFDPDARVKVKKSGKQKLIYQGKRYKVQSYEELLDDLDRLLEEHEFFDQFEEK